MKHVSQSSKPIGGSIVVSHAIRCTICKSDAQHFLMSPSDAKPIAVCRYHFWFLVTSMRAGDRCTALTIRVEGGLPGE